uniref:Peptidase S8/S53 domain-containing protein n=1 Tax=Solanum lycopersicum TaxID=4081 RepID=K4CJ83_SOLLC
MVYSYRHGFSGFAAKLTNSQAKQIRGILLFLLVKKSTSTNMHLNLIKLQIKFTRLKTTRSWDFLGLSKSNPNDLLNKANQGDGVIIGIVDTDGKVICKSEANFNATKHCNKKIIGTRWYIKGLMEQFKLNQTMVEKSYNLSPLDEDGHGTHVAYTAAGSYVNNVQYYGLNMGASRGGAPHARLAIYKAQEIFQGKDHAFIPLLVTKDVTNNKEPMIKLGQTKVVEGNEVFLKVAKFSSRGPNSFGPDILKVKI